MGLLRRRLHSNYNIIFLLGYSTLHSFSHTMPTMQWGYKAQQPAQNVERYETQVLLKLVPAVLLKELNAKWQEQVRKLEEAHKTQIQELQNGHTPQIKEFRDRATSMCAGAY